MKYLKTDPLTLKPKTYLVLTTIPLYDSYCFSTRLKEKSYDTLSVSAPGGSKSRTSCRKTEF